MQNSTLSRRNRGEPGRDQTLHEQRLCPTGAEYDDEIELALTLQ